MPTGVLQLDAELPDSEYRLLVTSTGMELLPLGDGRRVGFPFLPVGSARGLTGWQPIAGDLLAVSVRPGKSASRPTKTFMPPAREVRTLHLVLGMPAGAAPAVAGLLKRLRPAASVREQS